MRKRVIWICAAVTAISLTAVVLLFLAPTGKAGKVTARVLRVRDIDGLGFKFYATVVISNGTERVHYFKTFSECSTNGVWANSGFGMGFFLNPGTDLHVPVPMPVQGQRRITVISTPELDRGGLLNWRQYRAQLW